MIARSLFANTNFDPTHVQLIITLATPHRPVILLDQNLKEFYRQVDSFWRDEKKKRWNRLQNLTLISIGGGSRDKLVRPGLTYNSLADLNVLVGKLVV